MLANVVDTPEHCSFILPAVFRRDPIALAVSTGGASPALAKRLRDELGARIGDEHVALAHRLRELRPWAREHYATYGERRDYFELAGRGVALDDRVPRRCRPGRPRPDHEARARARRGPATSSSTTG